MQEAVCLDFLCRDGGSIGSGVDAVPELRRCGLAETEIRTVIPLHGRARADACTVTTFFDGQPAELAHADFIAVINKRHTGHGQQKSVDNFEVECISANGNPGEIMVATRNTDDAFIAGRLIVFEIILHKSMEIALTVPVKPTFGGIRSLAE